MSIYTKFSDDDIVKAYPTIVTTGLWSSDTGSLTSELYIDTQTGGQIPFSKEYYFDVYNLNPSSSAATAEVQFSVAYGHINGGGSPTLAENQTSTLASKAIYSQYRNLLLDPSDTKFTFNGVESDHIYVINIQRARMREQLDPGNWELPLSGANGLRTYIDASGEGALTATKLSTTKAGRAFSIVSGALDGTAGSITSSLSFSGSGYGIAYPDLGLIVLNPNAVCPDVGFFVSSSGNVVGTAATSSFSIPFYSSSIFSSNKIIATRPMAPVTHSVVYGTEKSAFNHAGLFTALNLATSGSGRPFKARSAETISSTHYFVRLRNKQYNYSNNPTFYNPDTGALIYADFRNNPKVFITTVGLYNEQNELLAVAKLSKPVPKSFDEEVLLRVRLDF
jgi:hypothetical protein